MPSRTSPKSLLAVAVVALAALALMPSPSSAQSGQDAAAPAAAAYHAVAATPAPPPPPPPPPARRARSAEAPEPPDEEDRYRDEERESRRAWLGVILSGEDGNRIGGVSEDSPAQAAGLRRGDRIVEIDGKEVASGRDILRTMRTLNPGDRVKVRVSRGDEEKTVTVTLAERPDMRHEYHLRVPGPGHHEHEGDIEDRDNDDDQGEDEEIELDAPHPRVMAFYGSGNYLGVEVHDMSEELRTALKAPGDRGVLVNKVMEGTPADEAGMRAGDIIIEVGDETVENAGDIGRALRDRDPGDKVDVKVIRNGSERTLDVKVARRPGHSRPGRHGMIINVPGFEWKQKLDVDGEAIRKAVDEAVREHAVQMRELEEKIREQTRQLNEQIREQLHRQMEGLKTTIRARNVYDI